MGDDPEDVERVAIEADADKGLGETTAEPQRALDCKDTQWLWRKWSRNMEDALIQSAGVGSVAKAGLAECFRGRGRTRLEFRTVRPPVPKLTQGHAMDEHFENGPRAHVRKLAGTFAAVRSWLDHRQRGQSLTTELCGAARHLARQWTSNVCVSLPASARR